MHVVCLSFLGLIFSAVLPAEDARTSESLKMPLDHLLATDIVSLIACAPPWGRVLSFFANFTATNNFHRKKPLFHGRQRLHGPHQDAGLYHLRLKHRL